MGQQGQKNHYIKTMAEERLTGSREGKCGV
jgi:hypothetical protein